MATETQTQPQPRTGRRKEAVARVRLVPGGGKHTINDRTAEEYLKRDGTSGWAKVARARKAELGVAGKPR